MYFHCELVLALILALTLNDPVHTAKIIGGHEAGENSRPYMVLVERTKPDGKKTHCGGFLLSKDFVMTAAHCNTSSAKVYVGLHNYNNPKNAKKISVKESFQHKDYEDIQYTNDFKLLKLSSEVKFSPSVAPILLAGPEDKPPKSCMVSGWGYYDSTRRNNPVLQEVSVTIIEKPICNNKYFYCSDGPDGPAEGDSGGPLVCEDGKAYGVVSSFTGKDNDLNIPDTRFYAKIPNVRDWIDSIIKSN